MESPPQEVTRPTAEIQQDIHRLGVLWKAATRTRKFHPALPPPFPPFQKRKFTPNSE
jgi:hypothetical protein